MKNIITIADKVRASIIIKTSVDLQGLHVFPSALEKYTPFTCPQDWHNVPV